MDFQTGISHLSIQLLRFFTEPQGLLFFNSIPFWTLFIAFLAGYALLRHTQRGLMMGYVVIFSLFFAFKANGVLMILLPLTALFTWMLVNIMREAEGKTARKAWLTLIVLLNLAPLVYFKYTNFLGTSISAIIEANFQPWDIALPVGISFYTFQGISHAVDVYRRRFIIRPSLLEYLFYLTFFPLLLAGPITRSETLFPQMRRQGDVVTHVIWWGVWLFIVGLLKKGVCADYLAQFVNLVFDDPTAYSGFENLMAVAGYTLQIYLDFSGYSDMAIGLAAMLGFRLRDNFNAPYQSLNATEFWHRWHISLSTWFRDYLYIPLGGNRKGCLRTYANNFVTMVVAGVWHGASWMFVIWGAMHGVALAAHKFCKQKFLDRLPPHNIYIKAGSWMLTMVFLMSTWVFFRAQDLPTALAVFGQIFTNFDIAYFSPFVQTRTLWCIILLICTGFHALRHNHSRRLAARFIGAPWMVKLLIFVGAVQLAVELGQSTVQPFIYAQF